MKTKLWASLAAMALAMMPLTLLATNDLPEAQRFGRYEAMMNSWPFAAATVLPSRPAAPSCANDLYVASVAWLADETVVTLRSKVDENFKEYLSTKGRSMQGYRILSIERSGPAGAAKIILSK